MTCLIGSESGQRLPEATEGKDEEVDGYTFAIQQSLWAQMF